MGDRAGRAGAGSLRCSKDRMAHTRLASALWGLSQRVQSSPLSLPSGSSQQEALVMTATFPLTQRTVGSGVPKTIGNTLVLAVTVSWRLNPH